MSNTHLCKKFGCSRMASGNFPACSITHGVAYKSEKEQVRSYQAGGYNFTDYYQMKFWPLEKVMYYANLV